MYQDIADIVSIVKKNNSYIKSLQLELSKIYEIIKRFSATRGIIFGGNIAIKKLTDEELELTDFMFHLYTTEIGSKPRELANVIYDLSPIEYKYLSVETKIPNQLVFIHIKFKPIITFHQCPTFISTLEFNDEEFLSYDNFLVQIYEKLSSPVYIKEWPKLYKIEPIMRKKFVDTLETRSDERQFHDRPITLSRWKDFVINNELIKVNNHTFIISKSYDEITKQLHDWLKEHDISFQSSVDKVNHVFDNQISCKKITFQEENQPRLDIELFDLGTYELVPFEMRDSIKHASLYTTLRIYLINIWRYTRLKNLKMIPDKVCDREIERHKDYFIAGAKLVDGLGIDKLIPLNFSGTLIDKSAIIKRDLQMNQVRLPKYYPSIK
ncbi:Uncharacterised protein [uncultured archaeon]|nr:Uncharacterised protein [uncultured archaeon]